MFPFANFTPRMALILAHDLLAAVAAVLAAFYIRFEAPGLAERWHLLLLLLPGFVLYSAGVFSIFGLYKNKWRFTSLPDLMNIIKVSTVLAVTLLVLDYVLLAPNIYGTFFFGKITIALYWFLQVFFLAGSRIAYRYFRYTRTLQHARRGDLAPTIVLGPAADAEVPLRGIESGALKRIQVIGILSPSRADRSQSIRGVPVLGDYDDLERVVQDFADRGTAISRLLMTSSALAPEMKPEVILTRARRLGLTPMQMSLEESGEALRLRPVNVEDLLLRPSAKIDYERLEAFVRGKSAVVTGGGGSIGAEICDRLATYGIARLMVIENSEPALHAVLEALAAKDSGATIDGRIADIRDRDRVMRLVKEFKPDIVFHAAALKHVPLLERDWDEGVKTNVFGSINVADAAVAAGAAAMVMISTDKAIEPISMLGATKRLAEMYCQALDGDLRARTAAARSPMRLIAVRFGNVLASNGSVVPKFKAQIERGGPVTVTHPRHGALLHDDPRGVRSRGHRRLPRARAPGRGHLGLRPRHGPAGEDRRSRRAHDPPVGPRAGPRTSRSCSAAFVPANACTSCCSPPTSRPPISASPASRPRARSIRRSRPCAPGSPRSSRASAATTARRSTACCATPCRVSARRRCSGFSNREGRR